MKILLIGSWHPEKAEHYRLEAEQLGKILADNNHTLIASPGKGIQGIVAQTYKNNKGYEFIGFYPNLSILTQVGEQVSIAPDTPIFTNETYAVRDMLQLQEAQGVIALTGGTGTLTELITCVNDAQIPTAYLQNSSDLLDNYLTIDKDMTNKLYVNKSIEKLVSHIEHEYEKTAITI